MGPNVKISKKIYISLLEDSLGEKRNYLRHIDCIENDVSDVTVSSQEKLRSITHAYSNDIKKLLANAVWNHLIGILSKSKKDILNEESSKAQIKKEIILKLADMYVQYTGEPPTYSNTETGTPFVRMCRVCDGIINDFYSKASKDLKINLSSHRVIKAGVDQWKAENANFLLLYKLSRKSK